MWNGCRWKKRTLCANVIWLCRRWLTRLGYGMAAAFLDLLKGTHRISDFRNRRCFLEAVVQRACGTPVCDSRVQYAHGRRHSERTPHPSVVRTQISGDQAAVWVWYSWDVSPRSCWFLIYLRPAKIANFCGGDTPSVLTGWPLLAHMSPSLHA